MIFDIVFQKKLAEIEKTVKNEIERDNAEQVFENAWYYSLRAWCDYYNIPSEAQEIILSWGEEKQVKSFTENTFIQWKPRKERDIFRNEKKIQSYLSQFLEKYLFEKNNMKITDLKIILLIAFIVTAIGYFLYYQSSQSNDSKKLENKQDNDLISSPKKSQECLILVINALKYKNVSHLATQGKISSDDSEIIYLATESMWLGLKDQIPVKLNECFNSTNQFQVPEGEESEYDIYMIKIELEDLDKGFKAEADQLARIDAFRRLPDLSNNIKISDRLKVNAYKDTGVYKR
jgi:uncharacterized protein (DUF2164 family)